MIIKKKTSKKGELKITSINMDLFTACEKIVLESADSKLCLAFFQKAMKAIDYISKKLDLTHDQSVMMALFVNKCDDNHITLSDLSCHLDCQNITLMKYYNDIDELVRRGLIKSNGDSGRSRSYRVPVEVIKAFQRDEKYVPKSLAGLSNEEFFVELGIIIEKMVRCDESKECTLEETSNLLESNPHLAFVKQVNDYNLTDDDRLVLMLFCNLFLEKYDDEISFRQISVLYNDNRREWYRVKTALYKGEHHLQEMGIIEFANEDGMANKEEFKITEEAKRKLFEELEMPAMNQMVKRENLLKSEDISAKDLFYEEDVDRQVAELSELLSDGHFQGIRSRLKESGFRCGFTCLFYGLPGTGKTETILQLARQSGRDIMQADVSKIKSMWVGESEKAVKALFENYRRKVKNLPKTPILLFNEADAIIGKRQEGAEKAVDKMENSLQNIILQEMETLDGILIATTNLEQNLDKAFERRFLYKIRFDKPGVSARKSIWKTMIPEVDDSVITSLAAKYDFSGGQIENIARRYAIDKILHGEKGEVLDVLTSICDGEKLERKENRIGF